MQSDSENEHELCDIGLDDTGKYYNTNSNGKMHQHNGKYNKQNDNPKRNNVRDKMEMARNAALVTHES